MERTLFLKYAVKTTTLTKDNRNLYLEKINSLGVQKGKLFRNVLPWLLHRSNNSILSRHWYSSLQGGSRVCVALTSMASLIGWTWFETNCTATSCRHLDDTTQATWRLVFGLLVWFSHIGVFGYNRLSSGVFLYLCEWLGRLENVTSINKRLSGKWIKM